MRCLCNGSSNFCSWNQQQILLLQSKMVSNLQEEMNVLQRSVYPTVRKHFEELTLVVICSFPASFLQSTQSDSEFEHQRTSCLQILVNFKDEVCLQSDFLAVVIECHYFHNEQFSLQPIPIPFLS